MTGAGVAALAVFICCLTADPSAMADEVSPVVAAPTAPSNPGLDTSQNQRHGLNMPASALKHRPKVTAVKPVKVIAKAQAHNLSAVRASRAGRRGTKTYNLVYAANYTRLAMGWSSKEFGCLNKLWTGESNWRPMAKNRRSGAYGIPQALPGHKMRVEGKDWKTNPNTQIRWGAKYIKVKYQTPCKALRYKHSRGWY